MRRSLGSPRCDRRRPAQTLDRTSRGPCLPSSSPRTAVGRPIRPRRRLAAADQFAVLEPVAACALARIGRGGTSCAPKSCAVVHVELQCVIHPTGEETLTEPARAGFVQHWLLWNRLIRHQREPLADACGQLIRAESLAKLGKSSRRLQIADEHSHRAAQLRRVADRHEIASQRQALRISPALRIRCLRKESTPARH